eukprot:scaffold63051_cov53-Phaeocystis_antarctica.AAC.1
MAGGSGGGDGLGGIVVTGNITVLRARGGTGVYCVTASFAHAHAHVHAHAHAHVHAHDIREQMDRVVLEGLASLRNRGDWAVTDIATHRWWHTTLPNLLQSSSATPAAIELCNCQPVTTRKRKVFVCNVFAFFTGCCTAEKRRSHDESHDESHPTAEKRQAEGGQRHARRIAGTLSNERLDAPRPSMRPCFDTAPIGH